MREFIFGCITMGYALCALFFLRFWRATRDRLFAIFSVAFFMLAINRLLLAFSGSMSETHTHLYMVRLAAFMLILYAIVDKNRART